MKDRLFIQLLKRQLPLLQLMVKLGFGEFAKRSGRCPFHADNTPSFSTFQIEGRWGWKCHAGCGEGDEVDFIEKARQLNTRDAIQLYRKLVMEGHPPRPNGIPVAASRATAPLGNTVSDATWQRCVASFGELAVRELSLARGFSVEFIQALKGAGLVGSYNGCIAFPIHGDNGQFTGIHYKPRLTGKDWLVAGGSKMRPLVIGDPATATKTLVFESQWDALAVMDKLGWHEGELRDTAIVVTRGASNGSHVAGLLNPEGTLFAFKQNDETWNGRNPADKWLQDVAGHAGCTVLVARTPAQFKDLNDWTRASATEAEIIAALDDAEPVPEQTGEGQGKGAEPRLPREPAPLKDICDLKQIPDEPDTEGQLLAEPNPETDGEDTPLTPGLRPFNDHRMQLRLPGDNSLLSDFARALGEILADKAIFNRGSGVVLVLDETACGLKSMTPEQFRTWVEQWVLCYRLRETHDGFKMHKRTTSVSDANGVLASQHFLALLRQLKRFNTVRLPVQRGGGTIELLPEGYDPESQTLTITKGVQFAEDIPLEDAKRVLDELFEEFGFADQGRSKSVAISAMLTLFAGGLLPDKSLLPCFIVLANAEGAGKTLLVKAVVIPVLGFCPIGAKPNNEDEIRKALLCAVMEAKAVLVFDNCKGHVSSAALEGFITSTEWSDRILGASKTFSGDKHTVVMATGNACTFSPDMRRRSLFCELFLRVERAEERQFHRPLEVPHLLGMREDILGALFALVRSWDRAGRPKGSKPNSSFPEWAATIGGIVEHAGYGSPVETAQLQTGGDSESDEMHELVRAAAGGAAFKSVTFGELAATAQTEGLFERIIGSDGTVELDRRGKTTFARLLKRFDRRVVADYMFTLEGRGHARRYAMRFLGDNDQPPTTPPPASST